MKKLLTVFLALTMVFLVACSGGAKSEEKHLATATLEQGNLKTELKYYGVGDVVKKMEQTNTANIESLDETQLQTLKSSIETVKQSYEAIEGVKYTSEIGDSTLVEKIILNVGDAKTLKELIKQDLLPVSDQNASIISLSKTLESLEQQGYKIEKH